MQTQTRPKLSLAEREQLLDDGYLNLDGSYLTLTERAWSWAESTRDVTLPSSPVAAEVLEALLRRLVPFLADRQIGLAELLPLRAAASPEALSPRKKATTKKKATKKKVAKKKVAKKPKKKVAKKPKKKAAKKPKKKATTKKKVTTDNGASKSHADVESSGAASQMLSPQEDAASSSLGERIESECLSLAHGRRKTRIMISALRRQLPDVDRDVLDGALLDLQDAERLVLYREDNTAALTDDDRSAALIINNEPRHLIMLEGSL